MAQRLALGFVGLLLAATLATAAQEFPRVVSAANVRLRIEPSEEVRIVTTLPLGTDVIELGTTPDRQWVRVRTADGREGWMLDDLSRRVASGQRVQVAQAIIWERLQRTGDGFESWIALTHFIDQERKALPDLEWEARFALYRLQALAGTALAGERYNRPVAPAFARWLDAHRPLLVRNESGGRWLLRRDVILAEHDRFNSTRVGDRIAWFAVTNGLPGECEGVVVCYLTRDDLVLAEYLRRMPAGAFVESAFRDLVKRMPIYRDYVLQNAGLFDPAKDCAEFTTVIGRIRDAVARIDLSRRDAVTHRDRALDAIDALKASAKGCGLLREPR